MSPGSFWQRSQPCDWCSSESPWLERTADRVPETDSKESDHGKMESVVTLFSDLPGLQSLCWASIFFHLLKGMLDLCSPVVSDFFHWLKNVFVSFTFLFEFFTGIDFTTGLFFQGLSKGNTIPGKYKGCLFVLWPIHQESEQQTLVSLATKTDLPTPPPGLVGFLGNPQKCGVFLLALFSNHQPGIRKKGHAHNIHLLFSLAGFKGNLSLLDISLSFPENKKSKWKIRPPFSGAVHWPKAQEVPPSPTPNAACAGRSAASPASERL